MRLHGRRSAVTVVWGRVRPGAAGRRASISSGLWPRPGQDRGTRALLVEARAEPALPAEVARRNEQFTELATPDFTAMGWSRPAQAARLWVVMAAEPAVAESAAGTRLPELRAALTDYLGG
jgi:hypothetical protein